MFSSLDDPTLWGRDTAGMEAIGKEGGMDGISIANFILGLPADNAPVATILRMDPGYVLPRHAHDCYRLEIVLQGSMDVGDRILRPGAIMFSEPRVLYGAHVAGPEGCTTIEIFSNHLASHTTLVEGPEGLVACDLWTTDGAQRMMEIVRAQMGEP